MDAVEWLRSEDGHRWQDIVYGGRHIQMFNIKIMPGCPLREDELLFESMATGIMYWQDGGGSYTPGMYGQWDDESDWFERGFAEDLSHLPSPA